jgi:hypothetical protein
MECLGLHNKPKAEVHPGHMMTGLKKEEEEVIMDEIEFFFVFINFPLI